MIKQPTSQGSLNRWKPSAKESSKAITLTKASLFLSALGICTMPKTVAIHSMRTKIKMKLLNRLCNREEEAYEQKM